MRSVRARRAARGIGSGRCRCRAGSRILELGGCWRGRPRSRAARSFCTDRGGLPAGLLPSPSQGTPTVAAESTRCASASLGDTAAPPGEGATTTAGDVHRVDLWRAWASTTSSAGADAKGRIALVSASPATSHSTTGKTSGSGRPRTTVDPDDLTDHAASSSSSSAAAISRMMIAATVNAVAAARCSPPHHQRFAPGVGRGEHRSPAPSAPTGQPHPWARSPPVRGIDRPRKPVRQLRRGSRRSRLVPRAS